MMKLHRQSSAPHQTKQFQRQSVDHDSMLKHSSSSSSSSSLMTGFRSAKPTKRNQELNYELKMKAKELEEHYAAYKLKVDHGVKNNIVDKRVVEVHKESLSLIIDDGEFIKGMFYRRYMEKREAKLRSKHRAKAEAKMNEMRMSLDRTHAELMAKKAEYERANIALNQIQSSDKFSTLINRPKNLSTSRRSTDSIKPPKSIPKSIDAEPKPFLKKGRSVGPGLGVGLSKIKGSSASKNFSRSLDIDSPSFQLNQTLDTKTIPSRGFKRFLNFGRKSNGKSSCNSSECSSPRDDLEDDYNHNIASKSSECFQRSKLSYSASSRDSFNFIDKGAVSFFSLNSFKNRGSDLKDRM